MKWPTSFVGRHAVASLGLSLALGGITACGDSTGVKCVLSGVSLSSNNVNIAVGEIATLTTNISQSNCPTATVSWTSSASGVASVAGTGTSAVVTGLTAGNATITATVTTETGSAFATAQVTVAPAPVATVTIATPSKTAITVNETLQLTANAVDARGAPLTGRAFTWTSTAPSVASVSATGGVVTGLVVGTTTITAASEGKTSTPLTINVTPPPNVAFGYVFANAPTSTSYQPPGFNGVSGQTNLVTRTATGVYRVIFNGIGSGLAPSFTHTVSASAPANNASTTTAPPYCSATQFTLGATAITLDVSCINAQTGALADATFRAMVVGANVLGGTGAAGRVAAFSSHSNFGDVVNYTPAPAFAWNSSGSPMTVVKTSGSNNVTHNMGVTFPAAGVSRIVNGFSTAHECSTGDYFNTGVTVVCLDRATGLTTNVAHTVLAVAGPRPSQIGAYVHVFLGNTTTPSVFQPFTTGATPTATRSAAGKYTVTFPGASAVGGRDISVSLTTQLDPIVWHQCTHFITSTSPVIVDVVCFDRAGVISESWGFGLLILQ